LNDALTNSKLRKIVRDLLDMSENAVRPANQNAPIYKGEEYATVQIVSEIAEGWDESEVTAIEKSELQAAERMSGIRRASVTIQYFNGDAYSRLRLLSDRFQSAFATQMFEDAAMGFSFVSGVQDLTGLLSDEEWQSRAAMKLDVYVEHEDYVRTPLIVQLPIDIVSDDGQTRESEVTT